MCIYRIPRRDNLLIGGSYFAVYAPYSGYATNENTQQKYHSCNWYQLIRTIMNSTGKEIDKVDTKQLPSKQADIIPRNYNY